MRATIEQTLGGDVVIHVTAETGTGSSTPTISAGAPDQSSKRRFGGLQEFSQGGAGVFTQTGPILVHAGEPYQIGDKYVNGGTTVVVNMPYGAPSEAMSRRDLARAIASEIQRNRKR